MALEAGIAALQLLYKLAKAIKETRDNILFVREKLSDAESIAKLMELNISRLDMENCPDDVIQGIQLRFATIKRLSRKLRLKYDPLIHLINSLGGNATVVKTSAAMMRKGVLGASMAIGSLSVMLNRFIERDTNRLMEELLATLRKAEIPTDDFDGLTIGEAIAKIRNAHNEAYGLDNLHDMFSSMTSMAESFLPAEAKDIIRNARSIMKEKKMSTIAAPPSPSSYSGKMGNFLSSKMASGRNLLLKVGSQRSISSDDDNNSLDGGLQISSAPGTPSSFATRLRSQLSSTFSSSSLDLTASALSNRVLGTIHDNEDANNDDDDWKSDYGDEKFDEENDGNSIVSDVSMVLKNPLSHPALKKQLSHVELLSRTASARFSELMHQKLQEVLPSAESLSGTDSAGSGSTDDEDEEEDDNASAVSGKSFNTTNTRQMMSSKMQTMLTAAEDQFQRALQKKIQEAVDVKRALTKKAMLQAQESLEDGQEAVQDLVDDVEDEATMAQKIAADLEKTLFAKFSSTTNTITQSPIFSALQQHADTALGSDLLSASSIQQQMHQQLKDDAAAGHVVQHMLLQSMEGVMSIVQGHVGSGEGVTESCQSMLEKVASAGMDLQALEVRHMRLQFISSLLMVVDQLNFELKNLNNDAKTYSHNDEEIDGGEDLVPQLGGKNDFDNQSQRSSHAAQLPILTGGVHFMVRTIFGEHTEMISFERIRKLMEKGFTKNNLKVLKRFLCHDAEATEVSRETFTQFLLDNIRINIGLSIASLVSYLLKLLNRVHFPKNIPGVVLDALDVATEVLTPLVSYTLGFGILLAIEALREKMRDDPEEISALEAEADEEAMSRRLELLRAFAMDLKDSFEHGFTPDPSVMMSIAIEVSTSFFGLGPTTARRLALLQSIIALTSIDKDKEKIQKVDTDLKAEIAVIQTLPTKASSLSSSMAEIENASKAMFQENVQLLQTQTQEMSEEIKTMLSSVATQSFDARRLLGAGEAGQFWIDSFGRESFEVYWERFRAAVFQHVGGKGFFKNIQQRVGVHSKRSSLGAEDFVFTRLKLMLVDLRGFVTIERMHRMLCADGELTSSLIALAQTKQLPKSYAELRAITRKQDKKRRQHHLQKQANGMYDKREILDRNSFSASYDESEGDFNDDSGSVSTAFTAVSRKVAKHINHQTAFSNISSVMSGNNISQNYLQDFNGASAQLMAQKNMMKSSFSNNINNLKSSFSNDNFKAVTPSMLRDEKSMVDAISNMNHSTALPKVFHAVSPVKQQQMISKKSSLAYLQSISVPSSSSSAKKLKSTSFSALPASPTSLEKHQAKLRLFNVA